MSKESTGQDDMVLLQLLLVVASGKDVLGNKRGGGRGEDFNLKRAQRERESARLPRSL